MSGPTSTSLGHLVDEPGPRMTKAVVRLLRPALRVISKHRWSGLEHIPRKGGVVLAPNHVSNFDPLVVSHVAVHAGRWPYFLAKASLFSVLGLGSVLRGAEQIPVHRNSDTAQDALATAYTAIEDGRMIIVYPEGTITSEPDGWPGPGKSGAARLALTTGCPVIPVGQWGAQAVLGMKKVAFPRLIPRPLISVAVGPPVDLDDLHGCAADHVAVDEATRRIMVAISALVGEIRGETAPEPTVR